jgi:hypothetical protein
MEVVMASATSTSGSLFEGLSEKRAWAEAERNRRALGVFGRQLNAGGGTGGQKRWIC